MYKYIVKGASAVINIDKPGEPVRKSELFRIKAPVVLIAAGVFYVGIWCFLFKRQSSDFL
ncbi:MAG: hypothetical protein DRP85_08970 [Candidatus Makaraimicrobium thalassicum]|nr:MAG: hypothetical protein DRP85_08970 [Candidatus Omnitrophota bacterium]